MAGLIDIPAEIVAIEADIAASAYAAGVKDLGKFLTSVGEFGESIGFKGTPDEDKICKDIRARLQKCVDTCYADKKKAAAGARDWKALLMQMLTTFLSWWMTPVPPAPTP